MKVVFSYDVVDTTKNEEVVAQDMRIFLVSKSYEEAKQRGIIKAQENYPEKNGFRIVNTEVWRP